MLKLASQEQTVRMSSIDLSKDVYTQHLVDGQVLAPVLSVTAEGDFH